MSADDFVEWYLNLDVQNDGTSVATVALNKYKIGQDISGPKFDARNKVLYTAIQKGLYADRNAFARSNYGKVSPDDCEHILSLAVTTGVVPAASLQSWADTNLGVDCTGFAVAYYDYMGWIDIDRYVGGASCFTLISKAINNRDLSITLGGYPLIWELDNVEPDDMILWMNAAQVETRAPGHISVIYDIDYDNGWLYCAESNGSGGAGPTYVDRQWWGPISDSGPKWVQLGYSDRVLIVRPPDSFG